MKTVVEVQDIFYSQLPTLRPLFKGQYPDDYDAESFAVINTLGVPWDPIQTVEVNVNCYAKDIQKGLPNYTKLIEMFNYAINQLHNYNNDAVDIEYRNGDIIREEQRQWHYYNLRFRLIFINN